MIDDIAAQLARARMAELHAQAEIERMCPRRLREPLIGSAVRRWYARAWWAARPRAATWSPGLLGS